MRVIVGLGNPGEQYQSTRHNAGFLALDELANRLDLSWSVNKKCQSELAKGNELMLVKPVVYMNNSGPTVRAVLSYYRLLPKKFRLFDIKNADLSSWLVVIHDDIDLNLGTYKITANSRSAGHRGVQSVIDHLHTKNFTRLRLGIRTELAAKIPTEKFVLQKFSPDELTLLHKAIEQALAADIFRS